MFGFGRDTAGVVVFAVLACATAVPAAAQTTRAEPAWDVEVLAGISSAPGSGTGTAIGSFPVGPALVTTANGPTSRAVSSWLFGDGAAILNSVNTTHGDRERVQPLDDVLRSASADLSSGAVFGVRVTRRVSTRWAAEGAVTFAAAPVQFTGDARTAMTDATTSFKDAWSALMRGSPSASNVVVSSAADFARDSGGLVVVTGAARYAIVSGRRVAVYGSAGLGGQFSHGSAPIATLTAAYRFTFQGQFPIDESERTIVRAIRSSRSAVGVLGAGVDYYVASGHGVRVDGRVTFASTPVSIVVTTQPTVAAGAPAFAISTFTAPSIQWSNNASATGRVSTLSGAPIDDLETFTGSGVSARLILTAGYFWRF